MERITIILLLVLASCSVKNEEDKETTQEISTNDVVPVVSDPYYDSLVRTFEPQIRTIVTDPKIKWLSSEPQGIGKWPDEYIKVIEDNFCDIVGEQVVDKSCTPDNFNITELNEWYSIITDYSSTRNGSSGYHNYVYDRKKQQITAMFLGDLYGIVTGKDYAGFVFHFNYIDTVSSEKSDCISLEQINPEGFAHVSFINRKKEPVDRNKASGYRKYYVQVPYVK